MAYVRCWNHSSRSANGVLAPETAIQHSWEFGQGNDHTVLKQTESGACVFLGAEGCMVHPDRPLVCRL